MTVDDSPSWQSLMITIAAEGRVYVISACQYFATEQFPGQPYLGGFAAAILFLGGVGGCRVERGPPKYRADDGHGLDRCLASADRAVDSQRLTRCI